MTNKELIESAGLNFHWSRVPGKFVNKRTGEVFPGDLSFTGTVREWYETLVETIVDVASSLERDVPDRLRCQECGTKRHSANTCVVSPDIHTILECSVLFKPLFTTGPEESPFSRCASCGQPSVTKVGSLMNRFTIYRDSGLPRNKVLVMSITDGKVVDDPAFFGTVTVTDIVVEEDK